MTAPYVSEFSGKISVGVPLGVLDVSGATSFSRTMLDAMDAKAVIATVAYLDDDAEETVSLGDLGGANVVMLFVSTPGAGKVLAGLTHVNGTAQVVPVEPLLYLATRSSPVTAITLQRNPGVSTVVQIVLCSRNP